MSADQDRNGNVFYHKEFFVAFIRCRTGAKRKLSNPPFRRKLKKQRPASAKEWGTHFLVKDIKSVKSGLPPTRSSPW